MLPVDFIMHEYLQKYFENIKKTRILFIGITKPLSIREPPPLLPAGGSGVLTSALIDYPLHCHNQHQ